MLKSSLYLVAFLATSAIATPLTRRAFSEQDYSAFQISDGVGGDAEALANAIFVQPFNGVDLSTVTKEERDAVNTMARAAVDNEEQFNAAIAAAGESDTADALQVGKIKNKVLKLTGEVQVQLIDQAAGKDVTEKLAEQQTKLTKNIAIDAESVGEPSLSFLSLSSDQLRKRSSEAATHLAGVERHMRRASLRIRD